MRKTSLASVLALAASLGGCAHNATFTSRLSGAVGTAKLTTFGDSSGKIAISLKGETYTGKWVYMQQGGSVIFGSSTAYSGSQTAFATGTGYAMPTQGNGSVVAIAPSGASLRCQFNYSEWSATGVGMCQDSKGDIYDMQID